MKGDGRTTAHVYHFDHAVACALAGAYVSPRQLRQRSARSFGRTEAVARRCRWRCGCCYPPHRLRQLLLSVMGWTTLAHHPDAQAKKACALMGLRLQQLPPLPRLQPPPL